jgi:hypothetical protein
VTRQALLPDWLLCQPPPFYDRASLLVQQQATLQAQATQRFRPLMPSFRLSCVRDVLQATRRGWAIELAQRKRSQARLQRTG